VPSLNQIRHLIQVQEEQPPVAPDYVFTCGGEVYRFAEGARTAEYVGVCGPITDSAGGRWWPLRCKECNIEMKRWQRRKQWRERFEDRFNYKRHRFYKFLAFSIAGKKDFTDLIDYRRLLVERFNKVRRTAIWKKHIDGGMWFFEVTTTSGVQDDLEEGCFHAEVSINPHMHVIVMGPKLIPIQELSDEFKKHGLGNLDVSRSRDERGRYCRPSPEQALGYLLGYLKKDDQLQGRNRQTFGNMWN